MDFTIDHVGQVQIGIVHFDMDGGLLGGLSGLRLLVELIGVGGADKRLGAGLCDGIGL